MTLAEDQGCAGADLEPPAASSVSRTAFGLGGRRPRRMNSPPPSPCRSGERCGRPGPRPRWRCGARRPRHETGRAAHVAVVDAVHPAGFNRDGQRGSTRCSMCIGDPSTSLPTSANWTMRSVRSRCPWSRCRRPRPALRRGGQRPCQPFRWTLLHSPRRCACAQRQNSGFKCGRDCALLCQKTTIAAAFCTTIQILLPCIKPWPRLVLTGTRMLRKPCGGARMNSERSVSKCRCKWTRIAPLHAPSVAMRGRC